MARDGGRRGGRGGGASPGRGYNTTAPPPPSGARSPYPNNAGPSPSPPGGRRGGGGRSSGGRGRQPGGGGSTGSRSAFDSSRVFGQGREAVRYEKDKGRILKVGPAETHRFQIGPFLTGLSAFIEYQRQHVVASVSVDGGIHTPNRRNSVGTAALEISASEVSMDIANDEHLGGVSFVTASEGGGATTDQQSSDSDGEQDTATSTAHLPVESQVGDLLLSSPNLPPSNNNPQEEGGKDDSQEGTSRSWWPADLSSQDLSSSVTVNTTPEAAPSGRERNRNRTPIDGPVQLSLRLERLDLTDAEASLVADWAVAASNTGSTIIRKLWLFGNRIGDDGAAAVARIVHPELLECHLSHNMITLHGAKRILEAVSVSETCPIAPFWLRLEWNRLSLTGLVDVLEAQHAQHGLLVDIPEAMRPDAAPPLPQMPQYLIDAKEAKEKEKDGGAGCSQAAPLPPSPGARGARNSLRFILEHCHCRLPWISSQFELPSESSVLKAAKQCWGHSPIENAAVESQTTPSGLPGPSSSLSSSSSDQGVSSSSGPLLIIPDTSALLAMIGATAAMTTQTFFTLDMLSSLASKGLFGRCLPPHERAFIVVPASVAAQLDALKFHPGARAAVRKFMGTTLDDLGPAGSSILTMLGANEGEGLILEGAAEVAGSRGADVASRGQAVDHRIVEVALFFQKECMDAQARHQEQQGGAGVAASKGEIKTPAATSLAPPSGLLLPVLLLTSDNGQAQLAKAHGLPTLRMSELNALEQEIMGESRKGQPLTASALRAAVGTAAVRGLGAVATRSLQTEFDGAVACLHAATDALKVLEAQIESSRCALKDVPLETGDATGAEEKVRRVKEALAQGAEKPSGLVESLERRLKEWDSVVRSRQAASRVLQWSGAGGGGTAPAAQ